MQRETIDRYFAAMRKGPVAEDELLALFADDAVYIEPFSGSSDPANGIDEIKARFKAGWEFPLPDLELDVLELAIEGDQATTTWECRSPALPAPVIGSDTYRIVDGKIAFLEVRIVDNQ